MEKNISPIIGVLCLSLIADVSQASVRHYNQTHEHDEKRELKDDNPRSSANETPQFDANVGLIETVFKPEYLDTPAAVEMTFRFPLDCMNVKVQLCEHNKPNVTVSDPDNDNVQWCNFYNINEDLESDCPMSRDKQEIKVEVTSSHKGKDNKWIVNTVWKNLTRGGAYYQVFYSVARLEECKTKYPLLLWDIQNWKARGGLNFKNVKYFGHQAKSNTPAPAKESKDFIWLVIIWVLDAIIFTSILYYWIAKYRKLLSVRFSRKSEPWTSEESVKLLPEKESNQILLVYVRDSDSLFAKEMENLKRSLKQRCSGCEIRDVYASAEFVRVSEIGAPGWVQELVDSGSKIVWIDTPQFRSCCKNGNDHIDNRDEAVQTAVAAAVKSLQNFTIQYRRHFVVRIKGFEVPDGSEDPLQVVTRHARYYIPDHIAILCEDLKVRR